MGFEYPEYAAIFNKGDDKLLVDTYFDENIIFSGTGRETKSREGVLKFFDVGSIAFNVAMLTLIGP
jgi:hypothetical protein